MQFNLARPYRMVRGELGLALIRTFGARGIAAGGSFVLVVVLGHLYGTAGVGVFALAESLIMAIATLGRFGMDNAVMRFVGRDLQSPLVLGYLRYAAVKVFLLSTLGGVALILSRSLWAGFFDTPELSAVLVGIGIAAPAFTLAFICSGFMRAIRKPATSCLLQKGVIALVAAGLIMLLQLFVMPDVGLVNIGIAYAVAAWVMLGVSLLICRRWFHAKYNVEPERPDQNQVRDFNRSSSAFFAANLARFMISVVGIWIAGYFLAASEVGLFKAAQQVALLIGFVLTVINAIFPPRFASLFHERNLRALDKLARQSALLGLLLAIIPVSICLMFPVWVLGLVGDGFSAAVLPLCILVIAQLIHVGCGPVGFLLNMSGHEQLVRNYAWASNIVGLASIIILTPMYGVIGVASGVAFAIVLQNVVGIYFAWRRLGIWMPCLPNLFQWVGLPACESARLYWQEGKRTRATSQSDV